MLHLDAGDEDSKETETCWGSLLCSSGRQASRLLILFSALRKKVDQSHVAGPEEPRVDTIILTERTTIRSASLFNQHGSLKETSIIRVLFFLRSVEKLWPQAVAKNGEGNCSRN